MKYKENIDGVALMHSSFPPSENIAALRKTMESKKLIKKLAKSMFYKNRRFLDRVGVRIEDVESIFTSNSYVAFAKNPALTEKILSSFLQQRGKKLAKLYRRVSAETVEDTSPDVSFFDQVVDYSNPEVIMIAKEEAARISRDVQEKLLGRIAGFVDKFIDRNRTLLDNAKISPGEIQNMVSGSAFDYAAKLYRNSDTIKPVDSRTFKRFLSVKMSRLAKDLRAVNG